MKESNITYRKISLREMLELMVDDICSIVLDGNGPHRFYWKDGYGKLHEIVECDLCRGRFITDNQDFSEFDWELKDSRIYVMED